MNDQPPARELDDKDREILNIIQSDFPIEPRPYRALGQRIDLSEDQVIDRVKALRQDGLIRRIGGNVSSKSVGYVSTLCTAQVGEDKLDRFVRAVNARPGVTHNYLRDDPLYNVWFTLISSTAEEMDQELAAIEAETGVKVYSLPAEKTYKIAVDFSL